MRRRIFLGAAAVALVTLVVGILSAAAVSRDVQRQTREDLFRQAEVTARLLEAELEAPTADGIRAFTTRARRMLELTRQVGDHEYVEAGVVVQDTLRSLTPDAQILHQVPVGDRQIVDVTVGGEAVTAIVRLVDIGRDVPMVLVIGRTADVTGVSLLRPVAVALVIGSIMTLALAWLLANRVANRLSAVEEATQSVADGELSIRVPDDGDDELAAVARRFNAMAAQLEAGRRRERDFLMSVGHDLRTPLTTIRGYAEAIESGDVPEEDMPRVANVLRRQTHRLSRLIEDLTLLSRLESREFTVRPETVDLAAHVKGIIDAHRAAADEARVRLDAELTDVGDVSADPDRIGQILGNLIDNALRYTPEGGAVGVALTTSGADGYSISVSDTGPGIDAADVPHIFERLYVAQRYRPVRPAGSGLGLAIVNELVTAMGGSIDVESALGAGTTVTVVMPSSTPPVG